MHEVTDILEKTETLIVDTVLLLLEHSPSKALPLIRRGLRGHGSVSNTLAVVLALFDRPWSRAELLAVLGDDVYHDLDDVLLIMLALEQSHDAEAKQVAQAWLIKYDPGSIRQGEREFDFNAQRLRDRAAALRPYNPV